MRDGRIVTTHVRALETPVDPADGKIVMRLFDPSFYTAYSATLMPQMEGRSDCAAEIVNADLDAAYAFLDESLNALPDTFDAEMEFPAVGEAFAEEVSLTCPS